MKRHPSLRDLSSDHHTALVQAHRLKRAAGADEPTRRTVADDFVRFWHEHAQRHFCEEEQALLPFFARWGEINQEPIHQMLCEHALIRRDAALLAQGDISEAMCLRLGGELEAHVRHEERVVFPLIEASLPPDALDALHAALAAWHELHTATT